MTHSRDSKNDTTWFYPIPQSMITADNFPFFYHNPFLLINHLLLLPDSKRNQILLFDTHTETYYESPCENIDRLIRLPGFGFAAFSTNQNKLTRPAIAKQQIQTWQVNGAKVTAVGRSFHCSHEALQSHEIQASPDGRYLAAPLKAYNKSPDLQELATEPDFGLKIWLYDCLEQREFFQTLVEAKDNEFYTTELVFTGPAQIALIQKSHWKKDAKKSRVQLFDWNSQQQKFRAGLKLTIPYLTTIYPAPDGQQWLIEKHDKSTNKKEHQRFYLLTDFSSSPKKIAEFSSDTMILDPCNLVRDVRWVDNTILFVVQGHHTYSRSIKIYDCARDKMYDWDMPCTDQLRICMMTDDKQFFLLTEHRDYHYFPYPQFKTPIDTAMNERVECSVTPFMEALDVRGKLPRPLQAIIQDYAREPMNKIFYPVIKAKPDQDITLRSLPACIKNQIQTREARQQEIKLPAAKNPADFTSEEKSALEQFHQLEIDIKALREFKRIYSHRHFKFFVPFGDIAALRSQAEKIVAEQRNVISAELLVFFKQLRDRIDHLNPAKAEIIAKSGNKLPL